ncbi:hypothetical protein D3C80_1830550 [compost metagenome]
MDYIYIGIFQQLFIVCVDRCVRISKFCFSLLGPFRYDIAKSDHDSAFHFLKCRHMLAGCDAAAADNPHF